MAVQGVNFTTTKIEILQAGKGIGFATGFFFRHDGEKFLATNRHVVIDEEDGHCPDALRILLHANKSDLTQSRSVAIPLYKDAVPIWRQHPSYEDTKSDVALLPLDANTLSPGDFLRFNSSSITFIGSEIINDQEVNSFGDVVVVGYPLGFHDEVHNLPVYRKAMIASCYGINFNGDPCFLIDANLHEGTSGSPVLSSNHTLFKEGGKDEGYKFFGVHSAEYDVDETPLGLSVVWYANLLVQIAEQ